MAQITFSQELKEELLHIELESEKLRKIELVATLKAVGILNFNGSNMSIDIRTSFAHLAKRVFKSIKDFYPNASLQTIVQRAVKFKREVNVYIVRVNLVVPEMLFDLGLINNPNPGMIFGLNSIIDRLVTEEEKSVYIRTFFICSGSVNNPHKNKQYHLEIVGQNKTYLEEIQKMLMPFEIEMKMSKRKNNYPLYINKSEEIADFLKFIGSRSLLFEFEDVRIMRDFRSASNRMNNAEIANEAKQMAASLKQIKAIDKLKEYEHFEKLSDKAKQVANLRLENPDSTLSELSEITNGEISKSNLSHHLRTIVKKAEEL
ncbi:DNA-binding protein WhiA [Mollicutes bacterium LVI A0078]|nr:DNA-binding protein WhiA [Mollicutes bacterium LVI A0075]WOO91594.1 DNA-binding protein WhiA [Mollicutes bacterium LVI A0078]